MSIVRNFVRNSRLLLRESVYTRKQEISLDRPVFSFTFDDAPVSSAWAGRSILEAAGGTGTYYISMGIERSAHDNEPFLNREDMVSLYSGGHDIQCHTYSHLEASRTCVHEYISDCARNREEIRAVTGQNEVSHFAYPFGSVSLPVKKKLGSIYKTMRTVNYGINHGRTDMSHLRSIEIFSNRIDRDRIEKAIEDTVNNNGWTIFYTHNVSNSPGLWGATPNDFQWVVDQCLNAGGELIDVSKACRRIMA